MKKPIGKLRVLVVTGSRSEFGLLRPVMEAVKKNKKLTLQVVVAGEHLLAPARTWREVEAAFGIDARVPMQGAKDKGRADHAAACGRGVEGFAKVIKRLKPDWVVVLGDRIEAFAAASAASIAGVAVCHIHGGDRAEGIADEAMRHAITKLAHLHCAATKLSAERIIKMGEPKAVVHFTGSPAIDGLEKVKPMSDASWKALGRPTVIVLLHPSGAGRQVDEHLAFVAGVGAMMFGRPLLLAPNSDPGSDTIRRNWAFHKRHNRITVADHLPRREFLSLVRRLAESGRGFIIGNSSAALIECAALGLTALNVGPRQAGREQPASVLTVGQGDDLPLIVTTAAWEKLRIRVEAHHAKVRNVKKIVHPYGDGRAGPRIAALLAKTDPHDPTLLRKRIAY